MTSWMKMGWRLLAAHTWIFFLFLYAPIFMLIVYSFNSNTVSMMTWKGFTFDWYLRVFANLGLISPDRIFLGAENLQLYSDPALGRSLNSSIIVGFSSASLATVIGTLTALGLDRYRFRGRTAYQGFLLVPIVIPDIVLGLALLIFLSAIAFPLGRVSVILSHTIFLSSYVTIVVGSRLAGIDRTLEEASADLGARPFTTFRRVTLPQLMPALVGGFLLSLVISFDDLVIAFFTCGVGSTTLPVFLFSAIKRNVSPEINAVACLMIVASMAIVALALLVRRPSLGSSIIKEGN